MTAPTTTPDAPAPGGAQVPLAALFADFDAELALTRRLLERFPEEHADWKPHEKSMTLARLASHVAELPYFGEIIATKPEWNTTADGRVQPLVARTAEELLAGFDARAEKLRAGIRALQADRLGDEWRFRNGDVVFFGGKRGELLRRFFVSHTAHHRGQLSVYYRMLDVPVPGLYGPSADEK